MTRSSKSPWGWTGAGAAATSMRLVFLSIVAAALWAALAAVPAYAQDHNGITSPVEGAPVRGLIAIEGIASHPEFRKWQLDLLLDGDPGQAVFLAFGESAAPVPALLTGWDSTLFPDGVHQLRLRVVHTDLNYDEYLTTVRIRNHTLAAPDLVTVALLPVQGPGATLPLTETLALSSTLPVTEATEAAVEAPDQQPLFRTDAPPDGRKLIEVDLSEQTLTAWQGDVLVFHTDVSTGKPEWWTLPGSFKTYLKFEKAHMKGGRDDEEYDTDDVPWTMYYSGDFAIHGAYWHNSFGTPVSHGCVNMRVDEAKALYEWAPLGTAVIVHE